MKFGKRSRTYSLHITHEIADSLNYCNLSCLLQGVRFHWNQVYKLLSQDRKAPHCDQEEEKLQLLPYDILADIFTRLPAKLVLLCARDPACRPIHPFTTSPSFAAIHLSRATPIIAFQYYALSADFDIDTPPEKATYKVSINFTCENTMMTTAASKQRIKIDLRFASPYRCCISFLYGSHNGFLLFKNLNCDNVLFIWNPITHEKMILDTNSLCHAPCAFYFHPKSREHRVLFTFYKKPPCLFKFIVVSLETKLSRLIPTVFSYPPLLKKNPIILNGALHWPVDRVRYKRLNGIQLPCSNSILAFDMDREEFQTISHPGNQCGHMQIIDMKGKLCYCECNIRCTKIRLWILEDYEKQVWVKRHVVNIDSIMNSISEKYRARRLYEDNIEVVHMYGDELLINLFCKVLFLYKLQSGTFRRAGKMSISTRIRPVAHINTLVALKKMDAGRHA